MKKAAQSPSALGSAVRAQSLHVLPPFRDSRELVGEGRAVPVCQFP